MMLTSGGQALDLTAHSATMRPSGVVPGSPLACSAPIVSTTRAAPAPNLDIQPNIDNRSAVPTGSLDGSHHLRHSE